jgi:hypothetical protein
MILAAAALLTWTTSGSPHRPAPPLQLDSASRQEPVSIGTVPPVPGFPVSLDGITRLTGPDGRARFTAAGIGNQLTGRVGLLAANVTLNGQQVQARATAFYPSRTSPDVALDLSYLVRFRYSGRDGVHVDPSALGTIVLKSDTGEVSDLSANQPHWLLGTRVTRVGSGLRVRELGWRVQEVDYAGSNLVNDSQQEFRPSEQQTVGVELLFYRIEVHAHDALFGFSRNGAVVFGYPDGSSHRFRLDSQGDATLPPLPRGTYTATVTGQGPKLPTSLTVSRDQEVQLPTYSWADVGTVLGGVLLVAVAVAWIGYARRRHRSSAAEPDLPRPDGAAVPPGANNPADGTRPAAEPA